MTADKKKLSSVKKSSSGFLHVLIGMYVDVLSRHNNVKLKKPYFGAGQRLGRERAVRSFFSLYLKSSFLTLRSFFLSGVTFFDIRVLIQFPNRRQIIWSKHINPFMYLNLHFFPGCWSRIFLYFGFIFEMGKSFLKPQHWEIDGAFPPPHRKNWLPRNFLTFITKKWTLVS